MPERMILLINFGGPRSRAEIPFFLENLTGRRPAPAMLEGTVRRYAAIGGFSSLPAVTEELAQTLASRLNAETRVKAAFMYSHPTISEVIRDHGSRVSEILVFVLSPFYATRTTGLFIKAAEESLSNLSGSCRPMTRFVHSWFAQSPFIDWWAEQVRKAADYSRKAFFLFSAHSMPVADDNSLYRSQVEEAVRLVADRADLSSYTLAWQSVPQRTEEEWMGPAVEHMLDALADRGAGIVIQVPIGFLIDNLETLYDIDIVHNRYAQGLGLKYQRLACPNADPAFVDALLGILSHSWKDFH